MRRTSPTRAATATSTVAVDAADGGEGVGRRRARGTRARRRSRRIAARAAARDARRRRARRRRRRARAASSARRSASARSRSSSRRRTLRLDSARPSGSRTVGHDLDRDRDVEVAHEPADDRDLLGVLLAEERDVGPDHVEELGHDGRDAVEVLGAAVRALERLGDAGDARPSWRSPAGRPRRRGGANSRSAPALGGERGVARLVARVGGEVARRRRTASG